MELLYDIHYPKDESLQDFIYTDKELIGFEELTEKVLNFNWDDYHCAPTFTIFSNSGKYKFWFSFFAESVEQPVHPLYIVGFHGTSGGK